MKKTISLALAAILLLGLLAGCSSSQESSSALDGQSLSDIVDKIYEQKDPQIPVMTMEVDLTDVNMLSYNTGLTSAEQISEAVVSEAAIGSQAYSLVLARVNDKADAKTVAEAMKAGIDPAKWICVMADDLRVASSGDVALLVMVSSELSDAVTADEIIEAFKTVAGGSLDSE